MSIKTITSVPPIDFLSVGQPLSAWSISGNSQQNGTPAPDAPIYPEFVGERTENLFDTFDIVGQVPSISNGQLINYNGSTTSLIPIISGNITVTKPPTALLYLLLYAADMSYIGYAQNSTDANFYGSSITGYENAKYCRLRIDRVSGLDDIQIMLNTGSTAKPYEPYGWKIPITCGSQTTPIYLGQVQTVRRIKKLVLTGEETWDEWNNLNLLTLNPTSADFRGTTTGAICTHLPLVNRANYGTNTFCWSSGNISELIVNIGNKSLSDLKTYLQQHYSDGTPVMVWYVLAESETGIVNEPLAKIGNYADTVSNTNTGAPFIPTSEGSNILTIGTTLQPSEVSITYMAPNTIAENLVRLQIARTNIATAITAKGGTLVENAGFEDFPDAISNIPSESGGMPMAGITILLYDGSTFGDAGPTTIIEEGSI